MEEKINNHVEEISLRELILTIGDWCKFLLSKWKTIFIVAAIGALIGLAYSFIKKPVFKAELSFALQDDKASSGGLGGALGLASQLGLDVGGAASGEFAGDNLLELMKSRSMVTRALLAPVLINNKKETLAEYYIQFNKLREGWKGNPELENVRFLSDTSKFTLKQDSILGVFHKAITAENLRVDKLDKKLSIISLTVRSTDELFSKYFTEALSKVVSDFYIQTKTEKATKNVAILQKQTDSVHRMVYGAITGGAEATDLNPNPNPNLATLRVPTMHRQVDLQANTAILTQLVTNLEIAKMSLLQATPLIQVIDRPILPLDVERVRKSQGILLGGFAGGFVVILSLIVIRFYRRIISDEL